MMQNELAGRKALADAVAGVIGSLVSMLVFYPVDVWKTNIQAGKGHASKVESEDEIINGAVSRIYSHSFRGHSLLQRINIYFRGISYKIAHTTVSSFTYFYVYSLVQSKYFAYRRAFGRDNDKTARMTTITRLFLAAFSAAINTCITLPLDTLSSRMQTGTHGRANGRKHKSNELKQLNTESESEIDLGSKSHHFNDSEASSSQNTRSQLYISSPEKFKFSFSTNIRDEAFTENPAPVKTERTVPKQDLQSIASLWNGLVPAILLCSNPAIQYTMYDTLKSWLMLHRQKQNQTGELNRTQISKLSMWESFTFGLVSKFAATITTYPLIRAKVMMMVAPMTNVIPDAASSHKPTADINKDTSDYDTKSEKSNSLIVLLLCICKKDGIRGLYRGCSLQLLHTVLKSALLLMVREHITFATHKHFQIDGKKY